MVVIADGTRQLIGDLFELQYLGSKDLKGIAGPVRGWAALRPGSAEGRFEALHGSGLTALVGREEELELLLRRWSKAKTGEGQVVLLSGEAGIGKSRLTAALLERLVCGTTHAVALFLLAAAHRQRILSDHQPDGARCGICAQRHRASKARQARCRAGAKSLPPPRTRHSLPKCCRCRMMDAIPTLEMAPQQRRQKTMEALTAQMEALSRAKIPC